MVMDLWLLPVNRFFEKGVHLSEFIEWQAGFVNTVADERWLFTRGSNYTNLEFTGNMLVDELLVAYGR